MTPGRNENLFNSDSNDNGNAIWRISANDIFSVGPHAKIQLSDHRHIEFILLLL